MFKNLIAYRIGPGWSEPAEELAERLSGARFAPCSPMQEHAFGWVEPRGEEGASLVEVIQGQWILKFRVESKRVPASVVNRRLDELKAAIEAESGRKPGRKETRALREELVQELLPMAFSRLSTVTIWIDPKAGLLYIDTTSQALIDELITQLIRQFTGLSLRPLATAESPAAAMAGWLSTHEAPVGFSLDRECELKATDDSQSAVRYARHTLDLDEIRGHIVDGKRPTRLAMTWNDRVSFVLTENGQVKRIQFLETPQQASGSAEDEGFDGDVALITGELSGLLTDLVEALGGEAVDVSGAPVASAAAVSSAPATADDESPFAPSTVTAADDRTDRGQPLAA